MQCPLCFEESDLFEANAYLCSSCVLVFKDSKTYLSDSEDFERYSSHQNNNFDQGYRDFLNKLVNPLKVFLPKKFNGLDFGCGPGPTLSSLLEDLGGEINFYDPHFFPDGHLLIPESYDVVTCTEVVEHFKAPATDWDLLVSLVREGGLLGIMTQFFDSTKISYSSWWYKNDPTHVVFYQDKTLNFITKRYNLEMLFCDNKSVVIFKKGETV